MDPEKAAAFAEDLVDQDKLKDLTAADGTLPGGECVALSSPNIGAAGFPSSCGEWQPPGNQALRRRTDHGLS